MASTMKWQTNHAYDPRASPPGGRPMRAREMPHPPPMPPHHHRLRHPHGVGNQYHGAYRPAYGQPRHQPPPPGRSYEYSRYYDYHHTSSYGPPPPPPPPHAPQYAAPPPSRLYGEGSPEPRCSPPRESPLGGSPTLDPFRTGGCTCKKSRCLKLYCQCFALSTTCGPKCKCQTCHNTTLHADAIEEARKTILERNPSAFDDKFRGSPVPSPYRTPYSPAAAAPAWSYTAPPTIATAHPPPPPPPPPPRVNKFGCKCRRSFCLKKYCECYQNSVHCGLNCRCVNCKNFPSDHGSPPHGSPPPVSVSVPHPNAGSPRSVSEETAAAARASIEAKAGAEVGDEDEDEEEDEDDGEETPKKAPEDRMAIMAAVAMTQLFGESTRRVSMDTSAEKRKAEVIEELSSSSAEHETTEEPPKKIIRVEPKEESPVRPAVESRNPSPISMSAPRPYMGQLHPHRRSPVQMHHHHHHHYTAPRPFPYYGSPQTARVVSSTYEDVTKTSGLPKALSFRKICSKCGKTRGEHGELGFGNKCVYQDCGKCGAGVQVHTKAGTPMGILCRLTVEEGATPGASASYDRKIRDLAARAELQKSLLEDKRERAERLAQAYP